MKAEAGVGREGEISAVEKVCEALREMNSVCESISGA